MAHLPCIALSIAPYNSPPFGGCAIYFPDEIVFLGGASHVTFLRHRLLNDFLRHRLLNDFSFRLSGVTDLSEDDGFSQLPF